MIGGPPIIRNDKKSTHNRVIGWKQVLNLKACGGGGGIVTRKKIGIMKILLYNLTKQTFNYAMSSPMNT